MPPRPQNSPQQNQPESITLNSESGMQTRSNVLGRGFNRIFYPENQSEEFLGKIRFAVHEATPLALNAEKINETPIQDRIALIASDNEINIARGERGLVRDTAIPSDKQIEDQRTQAINDSSKVLQGVSYKLSKKAPIVDMYIPLSLTYNDGAQYENANLNALGSATLEGMSNANGVFQSAFNALVEGVGSVFSYLMDPSLQGEAARLGALRASRLTGNAGFQAAVAIGVQRTMNPNTRAMFKGVNLREFTFSFKMIANSQKEAIMIERIVNHFRMELYPDVINALNVPIAYQMPNAFSIMFTHRGAEAKMPKLEYCFLRNIQTVYNGTGAAFHPDGRPNEVDMTLSFVEMRTLNRQDILKGY
jgi:hypothetical protein